jgi:predicted secreted protein
MAQICEVEACDVSRKNGNKLLVDGMDYLRRRCSRTGLDRIRNETVREMEVEKDATDKVQKRQLIRFGHGNGMEETGWPRESSGWVQQEENKRGRP